MTNPKYLQKLNTIGLGIDCVTFQVLGELVLDEHLALAAVLETVDWIEASLKEVRKEVEEAQAKLPESCGWSEEVSDGC